MVFIAHKLDGRWPIFSPPYMDYSPIWILRRIGKLSDQNLAALLYKLVDYLYPYQEKGAYN